LVELRTPLNLSKWDVGEDMLKGHCVARYVVNFFERIARLRVSNQGAPIGNAVDLNPLLPISMNHIEHNMHTNARYLVAVFHTRVKKQENDCTCCIFSLTWCLGASMKRIVTVVR
jgi:hypothetical protein